MDQKISIRLSPPTAAYLAKLQAENGGSLSDVMRDLIEQARQRSNQAGLAEGPAGAASQIELAHIHEVVRYVASLVTALVRKAATTQADADALIKKAIADATPVSASASVPETGEKG